MDLGLAGRACVVTGASSGIGQETARQLAAAGASVLLVGRNAERLAKAADLCVSAAAGGHFKDVPDTKRTATQQLDITAVDAGERMLAACREAFGRIDILVNNAGFAKRRPMEEVPDADWQLQFELNVMGPMRAMRAIAPVLAEQGWGRIVNVSSSAGKRPSAEMSDYSVAKAAELSLSRLFAEKYAASGVLVNAVCPGPTASELWIAPGGLADQAVALKGEGDRKDALESAGAGRPIGRLAEVGEIAATICFLCSERASYVTGAAWSVDGGSVPGIL